MRYGLLEPHPGLEHRARLAQEGSDGTQYRSSNEGIVSYFPPVILPLVRACGLFVPNVHHRALRDELFPMDEPTRNQVHRAVAALIMRAFDRENPGSDVEDETMVTMRTERHGYVKKTPYIAGDLRAANLNELAIMTDRFLSDPAVMSGTLEPGPDIVPYRASTNAAAPRRKAKKAKGKDGACAVAAPSAAVVTDLSGAAAVGKKRGRSKAEGCGLASREDGGSLPCLWGIHLESQDAGGVTTVRLKMKLGVVSVNGEECVSRKKIKIVRGVVVNAPNMAALQ